jgi:hypothetical protein
MTDHNNTITEDGTPTPEYLIKSIAEQGYSLETSLADLMDNSISANADKVEVLVKMDKEPFTLFLADNGDGMSEESLKQNMKFPSNSPDLVRNRNDLGRFGLGMKTASFAQTRCFTVLSRRKGTEKFSGRTWDVNYLKEQGWKIKVNNENEINSFLETYKQLSENHLNRLEGFVANTIVIWSGLYKFENYLNDDIRKTALQSEINDVTNEHLSVVFHRFMERKTSPLQIRVNNILLTPFNPFPVHLIGFRSIENKQRNFKNDIIKMEGFVLPAKSMAESKQGISPWTTRSKGLMDMEGLYIYRSDRLIRFGGWNGIIKKSPRLQLARLMVEVGNGVDHLIHLNVAKSQITIPHDLKQAFLRYIAILTEEAEKEYHNNGGPEFSGRKSVDNINLFKKIHTSRGALLTLNEDFPALKELRTDLNENQNAILNLIFRMITTTINKIRQVHEEKSFNKEVLKDDITENDLLKGVAHLVSIGISTEQILESIIPNLGYSFDSLPEELKKYFKK